MATAAQIRANRANATRSTGLRTPKGKAVAAQNPIQHGLTSQQVVIQGEDPEAFHDLENKLIAEWAPATPTEDHLLQQMAIAQWRLARIRRFEVAVWNRAGASGDLLTALDAPELDKLRRYEGSINAAYHRGLGELQRLQKDPRKIGSASYQGRRLTDAGISYYGDLWLTACELCGVTPTMSDFMVKWPDLPATLMKKLPENVTQPAGAR